MMHIRMIILVICICIHHLCKAENKSAQDIYIIVYATYKGKSGHAGIAIDKYKIVIRDVKVNDSTVYVEDTVKTGELQYFDFWPDDDQFNKMRTAQNIPGIYFKLPEKLFDEISINSLVDKGIPHKENYPPDGLLRIRTSVQEDYRLLKTIDSTVNSNRDFNVRKFNCTDFVLVPLQQHFKRKIAVREFIPFAFSSTPNKLYQRLLKMKEVEVIKCAGAKTKNSFLKQRVFYKIFNS